MGDDHRYIYFCWRSEYVQKSAAEHKTRDVVRTRRTVKLRRTPLRLRTLHHVLRVPLSLCGSMQRKSPVYMYLLPAASRARHHCSR